MAVRADLGQVDRDLLDQTGPVGDPLPTVDPDVVRISSCRGGLLTISSNFI